MKKLLTILLLVMAQFTVAQEICDNGIDDDGDTKIDLNDTDCSCGSISLIQNSSFENATGCPTMFGQLEYLTFWSNGTDGTSDYIRNDCEDQYNGMIQDFPNLLNFPDGNGIAGAFFSGETIKTTLTTSLIAGENYQLSLKIASVIGHGFNGTTLFYPMETLQPVSLTIYGNTSSNPNYLNFLDITNNGWFILGQVNFQPATVWKDVVLEFTPTTNVNTILIGRSPSYVNPFLTPEYTPHNMYNFYDRLNLNTVADVGVNTEINGDLCHENVVLSATITASTNTTFSYQWYHEGQAIVGATSSSYDVSNGINFDGSYNVLIRDDVHCYLSAGIFVDSPFLEPPVADSLQYFCVDSNATLNEISITGENIIWYNAAQNGNIIAGTTLVQDGITYYASQSTAICESAKIPITISIVTTPQPSGSPNQLFCDVATVTIDDLIVSGTNIKWYDSPTSTVALTNSVFLTSGTTYYATQTVNGCESVNRLAVLVTIATTLPTFNYNLDLCDSLNDGSETILLTDYNSNLISSTTDINFSYYPDYNSAENADLTNQINPNYTINTGTTFVYVRIDFLSGCHTIVLLRFTLHTLPTIPIGATVYICPGIPYQINTGSGFDSYLWSTNETSSSISVTQPGNYSLTVSNTYGTLVCSETLAFTVSFLEPPTIIDIDTMDFTDTENSVLVTVDGNGDYEYSIDGIHYQDSALFTNLIGGEYTVYVRNKLGCGIISEEVYLLSYPKYFTPNNDGIHDHWKIKFSDLEPNLTVKLFDRYGKFIHYFESTSEGWDGTYNGNKLPADDYWFVVVRENGKEHRGHFTLKR
jgi:gliding motility-associated-like protein